MRDFTWISSSLNESPAKKNDDDFFFFLIRIIIDKKQTNKIDENEHDS